MQSFPSQFARMKWGPGGPGYREDAVIRRVRDLAKAVCRTTLIRHSLAYALENDHPVNPAEGFAQLERLLNNYMDAIRQSGAYDAAKRLDPTNVTSHDLSQAIQSRIDEIKSKEPNAQPTVPVKEWPTDVLSDVGERHCENATT